MSQAPGESKPFTGAHPAALPANEAERLRALHELKLLDTLPEAAFDDIVQIASAVCGVPIALISLVDAERQWFKAKRGLDAAETHRDLAFCAHAIRTPDTLFEIADASADARFATNPLVTGDPNIRFYAGTPLVTPDGQAIGTLCVIDRVPRSLTDAQREALAALGRRVMAEIELRRSLRHLEAEQARSEAAHQLAGRRGALLETIIEAIPSAVVVADLEGRILVNNPAAQKMSGMTTAEIPADPAGWPAVYGICAPDGRVLDLAEVPLARALGGASVDREELLIRNPRRPAGTVVEASARPLLDEAGQRFGGAVVFTDIDQLRRVGDALAANERRYRSLIDSVPGIVYRTEAVPPWRLQFVSEAVEQLTGYPSSHFIEDGTPWGDLVYPGDVDRMVSELSAQAAAGLPMLTEYRIRHRDGHLVWVEGRASAVLEAPGILGGTILSIDDRKRAEAAAAGAQAALRENARQLEYFRQIAEGSSDFIALAGLDRRISYINPAGRAALGLDSLAEVQQTELLDYVLPHDLLRATGEWLPTLLREGQISVDIDMRHFKSGKAVPTQWRAFVLRDPDSGEPYAVAAHALFLAERLKLEAERETQRLALTESEARFRSIVDNSPGAVFRSRDEPGWPLEYVSDVVEKLMGYTPQDFTEGRVLFGALILPEDVPAMLPVIAEAKISGRDLQLIFRIRRRDGAIRTFETRARQATLPDGSLGYDGVFFDITEMQQAASALAASEARFRLMTDAVPLILWSADANGRLDFMNRSAADYTGRPAEELLGTGWLASVHPDDLQPTLERWAEALRKRTPVESMYRARRHDGTWRWHIVRVMPELDDAGHARHWYGTITDIEDLRRAQTAAEEASRAKSAFLSSMSHEIRTPMNAVIGMTSILLDSDLRPEQREYAQVIRASGDHLLTIINDILDYSKIEAGKLELEHAAFSLRECVEGTLDLISAAASEKGVELGYLMEAGTPESVLGDIGRIRQVLLNLLSNAVKFTPAGGEVMVDVRARPREDGRLRLEISVSDSGIGIPAEVLPQLFRPFTQADVSITRRFGGTGLGLTISRRLVQAMGGDIGAESTPGRGSVFRFDIVVDVAAVAGRYTPQTSLPQLSGLRVLIVDDIEINRRILIHYVNSWGMVPLSCATPAEALEWMTRGDTFDLALLDYHMPEMDGLTLAQKARALAPRLPIVILSSVVLESHDAAIVSGSMLKPIKPARLLETVMAALAPQASRSRSARAEPEVPRELGHMHPLRILVVEDNTVNQRVARLLLERMGYLADFAGNGQEALASIERQHYDAVLMDVQMPVMDGCTATRELCRRYKPAERPRIIGMTANATEEDRRLCVLAGMDDYLAKPVRPQELAAALQRTPSRAAAEAASEDYSEEGLAELRRIYGDEGTAEIVAALVGDLRPQITELRSGLERIDLPAVQRVAHTLKSNCRLVGAMALGQRWNELERETHDGITAASGRLALALGERYGRLVRRLSQEAGAGVGEAGR